MIDFIKAKRHILSLLCFCLLYLLYILVGEIWFIVLYAHDNWINLSGMIIVAILLLPLYTFINTKLSIGIGRYIFYIPVLPFLLERCCLIPLNDNLFPHLFVQDDLGAGILMMMLAFPHWAAMMLSFLLADRIKMRRKEGEIFILVLVGVVLSKNQHYSLTKPNK